jgi:hypothetical protein
VPTDERYRVWAMAPRRYRIVDRRSGGPGEVTLMLAAPGDAVAYGPAGNPVTLVVAVPGQWT